MFMNPKPQLTEIRALIKNLALAISDFDKKYRLHLSIASQYKLIMEIQKMKLQIEMIPNEIEELVKGLE